MQELSRDQNINIVIHRSWIRGGGLDVWPQWASLVDLRFRPTHPVTERKGHLAFPRSAYHVISKTKSPVSVVWGKLREWKSTQSEWGEGSRQSGGKDMWDPGGQKWKHPLWASLGDSAHRASENSFRRPLCNTSTKTCPASFFFFFNSYWSIVDL